MTYNQKRHLQLLKRSQDFENQGKSLYKESIDGRVLRIIEV